MLGSACFLVCFDKLEIKALDLRLTAWPKRLKVAKLKTAGLLSINKLGNYTVCSVITVHFPVQWNPSKADNLEPQFLSIIRPDQIILLLLGL